MVAPHALSLVAASGGYFCCGAQICHCSGFSLQSVGSRAQAQWSWYACSVACGIFPDPGFQTRACPLHWQADSSPLDHQESPLQSILMSTVSIVGRGPGTRNEWDRIPGLSNQAEFLLFDLPEDKILRASGECGCPHTVLQIPAYGFSLHQTIEKAGIYSSVAKVPWWLETGGLGSALHPNTLSPWDTLSDVSFLHDYMLCRVSTHMPNPG